MAGLDKALEEIIRLLLQFRQVAVMLVAIGFTILIILVPLKIGYEQYSVMNSQKAREGGNDTLTIVMVGILIFVLVVILGTFMNFSLSMMGF